MSLDRITIECLESLFEGIVHHTFLFGVVEWINSEPIRKDDFVFTEDTTN